MSTNRLMKQFQILTILLFLHLHAGEAAAATTVLTGRVRMVYDLITDNPTVGIEYIPAYSNLTFSQRVISEDEFSKRVEVVVDLARTIDSASPFPVQESSIDRGMRIFLGGERDIQVEDQLIRRTAKEITSGAKTVVEAHSAVADWVKDNLTYDAGKGIRQDASSVIRSKRGSCVGHTNLSIALLRAAGIPARYAHGYLPPGFGWGATEEFWGVKVSRGGYHAWYESYIPGAGWAFSDGESSKNFVDPAHIVRYIDGININPDAGKAGTLDFVAEEGVGRLNSHITYTVAIEEKNTRPVDQIPSPAVSSLFSVRTGPVRYGTVWGKVAGTKGKRIDKGDVILWNGNKGTVIPFEGSEFTLVGLEAEQALTFRAEGYRNLERKIRPVRGKITEIEIVMEEDQKGISK